MWKGGGGAFGVPKIKSFLDDIKPCRRNNKKLDCDKMISHPTTFEWALIRNFRHAFFRPSTFNFFYATQHSANDNFRRAFSDHRNNKRNGSPKGVLFTVSEGENSSYHYATFFSSEITVVFNHLIKTYANALI